MACGGRSGRVTVSSDAERSLPPTQRRLAKAHSQGRAARSAAATAALTLVACAAVTATLRSAAGWWLEIMRSSALQAAAGPRASVAELIAGGVTFLHAVPPWSVVACAWMCAVVASVAAAALCGGLQPAWPALRIDGSRISWAAGAKKLAALDGAGALVALGGASAIAISGAAAIRTWAGAAMQKTDFYADACVLGAALSGLWRDAAPLAFVVGAIDAAVQRVRFVRSLRMTAREVREERADNEGRPEVKARRRHTASKRARDLRIGAIRQATAVVTNPTHIAVALRYAPPQIDVPIVVARGADLAAAIVRGAAESYGVPVVEAPELARMLYAQTESEYPIPEEAFAAVAAVFAWILRTHGALAGGDTHGDDLESETA